MGLIDSIKRRRLAKKGMSSGKKRRTHDRWSFVGSMDKSVGLRLALYLVFITFTSVLVYQNVQSLIPQFASAIMLHVAVCIGLIMVFEIQHNHKPRNARVLLVFGAVMLQLLTIPLIGLVVKESSFHVIAIPYALAPLIASVLLGKQGGVFSTISVTLCGMLIVPHPYLMHYIVMSLFSGMTVILLTKNVRKRGSLLRAGFYAGLITLILAVMFGLIEMPGNREVWKLLAFKAAAAVGISLVISMIVSGILPMLESIFAITTDISWLELSDLNHKLLKRMQLEAPGTFHHSLVVASLAEAAAESIGARAAMCRVCSYFHDVGKLKKPEYFIENQGDANPHDSLTPTMSALVIIAHVKDGVDLAVKHKLNPLIIDVIKEHHGDSLVYYFYHKAKEQQRADEGKVDQGLEKAEDISDVGEKSFRYPGPTPSSKESGIISLADAVESASRTIQKPTPAKIQTLVDDLVMKRLKEGQLDNCGISMKELKKVRKSFSDTLRSMLHSRIDYPKDSDGNENSERAPSETTQLTNISKVEKGTNDRVTDTVENEVSLSDGKVVKLSRKISKSKVRVSSNVRQVAN